MMVAVLVGIMIAVVVGISLIPAITSTIANLPSDTPAGLTALINVLPYLFVAVILLGAVSWVARGMGDGGYKSKKEDETYWRDWDKEDKPEVKDPIIESMKEDRQDLVQKMIEANKRPAVESGPIEKTVVKMREQEKPKQKNKNNKTLGGDFR